MPALPAVTIRPVKRSGLRDEVYQSIIDMLIESRLPPGTALRVEPLSRMLGVSPTPVREALVQLESTGLVEYLANRGYRVADAPGTAEFSQIMDARLVLEVAAVRRAAERDDRSFTTDLNALIDSQTAVTSKLEAPGAGDAAALVKEYLALDHAFHDVIFRVSGNPYLARLSRSLDAQSQRARQSYLHGVDDADDALAEHRAIVAALEAGDADLAEHAIKAHLERIGIVAQRLLR